MADTQRLEAFLASVGGRSRRALRKALEAALGDPANTIRRHAFAEMLVDAGGYFAEYTDAKPTARGGVRITIHGPVLHRVDGAIWDPEEATRAGQRYARWLLANRPPSVSSDALDPDDVTGPDTPRRARNLLQSLVESGEATPEEIARYQAMRDTSDG